MTPLVEARWLAGHLGEVVVADCRWDVTAGAKRAEYEAGHIPGAVFVDIDRDLSGPRGSAGGRHPLPSPGEFAATMSRLGIGDDDVVVAYDDASGGVAARLWWMLTATGHEAAVLDGGVQEWRGPLQSGATTRPPAPFTARPFAGVVSASELSGLLLDARAPERYRGEVEPVDVVAGHIPGAVNAPFAGNLSGGRFLKQAALRRRYEELGVTDAGDVTCYCGSGVTACHDLLAMEVAGLGRGRLYAGSWSDWISDPGRPVSGS